MGAQAKLADFRLHSRALDQGRAVSAAEHGLLRFITCGSVDDGKSTLIGRLLYDSNALPEDQLEALRADSKASVTRAGGLDFSLLVDGLAAEREQGITIDVAYRYFSTSRRSFIVADTPGHEQYTRNMATGASTASLAIVLVDARKGILAQTRRHSFILSLLGVRHLVLAVNKMDLVGYSERTFSAIDSEYRRFAAPLGFASIESIPLSALLGDNIRRRSARMPWYQGPALIEHLETIEVDDGRSQRAFRMPVQWVNRPSPDFRGSSGLITSGAARPGDAVRIMPSGGTARIARIVTYDGDKERAASGQSVTLVLDRELDVSRGDVIASDIAAPRATQNFAATLLWTADAPFEAARPLLLKAGASTVPVRLDGQFDVLDIGSGERRLSRELRVNDIASSTVVTDAPIVVELYAESPELGGFILIDRLSGDTVALGMVDAIDPAQGTHAERAGRREWLASAGERHWRSLAKAVTWRATGSVDTFVLAWLFTGNVRISAALSATEMLTKIVLYYAHERVWARVGAGVNAMRRFGHGDGRRNWRKREPAPSGECSLGLRAPG